MIRPRHIAQVTFGDKTSGNNGAGADDTLGALVAEIIGIVVGLYQNGIGLDLLADITGNQVSVVAIFQ